MGSIGLGQRLSRLIGGLVGDENALQQRQNFLRRDLCAV
jgi:hypothetical protein